MSPLVSYSYLVHSFKGLHMKHDQFYQHSYPDTIDPPNGRYAQNTHGSDVLEGVRAATSDLSTDKTAATDSDFEIKKNTDLKQNLNLKARTVKSL